MNTRFLKVLRDIGQDPAKNFMLVIAIVLGVFGIGTTLGTRSVLTREMLLNYRITDPASATIETERGMSAGLVDSIRALEGVKVAERHATIIGRMKVNDKWYRILLFVIDDFNNKKTNKIRFLSGSKDPAPGTMLVERSAYVMMRAVEGDSITISTPNGKPITLKITGTVHDAGLAPAYQEQSGYGYISLATLEMLGESSGFDQLRLITKDESSSQAIRENAEQVATFIEDHGYKVHEIRIPPTGKHPHQSQMNAVLTIFMVFSFLLLLLGSVLVATSVATMMVKQVRQIGVMKTIGASPSQITAMYFGMMTVICSVALVIAIPLSLLASSSFIKQISGLLNVEIVDSSIPLWVLLLLVALGIFVPIIIAAVPVIRGSRISVRSALDNFGVNLKSGSLDPSGWRSRLFANNETLKISIRNIFRQQWRLALTLTLLGAGGAIFMTAMNVSDAWSNNLKRIGKQRIYDLEVKFDERIPIDLLLSKIKSTEGVKDVEAWDYSATSFGAQGKFETTHTYPDQGHGSFTSVAVPVNTKLLHLDIVDGTWLREESPNGVVLNQMARLMKPDLKIGDDIILSVEDSTTVWKILGFSEDVGAGATVYLPMETFRKLASSIGQSKSVRISYADRSHENANIMNAKMERLFEGEKVPIDSMIPVTMLRNAIAGHMKVLINSLMGMAILMGFVGAIGLMSTMSMSVMERTREIGVMRAIGGTPNKITFIIAFEGLTIGLISIVITIVLGIGLSYFLGRYIGSMAFKTPLSLSISWMALLAWILIILVGSYLASWIPARRAGRITTREALAYE